MRFFKLTKYVNNLVVKEKVSTGNSLTISSGRVPKHFYLIMGLTVIFFLGDQLIVPILPIFVVSVTASKIQLGMIMALPSILAIITRVPIGVISKKSNKWLFVLCSLLVQSTSFTLYSLVSSPFWLYPITLLYAIAYSTFGPISVEIASGLTPDQSRGESLGKYYTAVGAGLLLGPILCSLFAAHFDLRQVFLLTAILPFFGIIAFLIYRSRAPLKYLPNKQSSIDKSKGSQTAVSSIRKIVGSRNIVGVCFAQATFAATYGIFRTLFPVYAKEELFLTPSLIGLLFASKGITNLLIRLPTGKISDTIGRKIPNITALILTIFVFLLLSETQNFLALALIMALYGLGHGMRPAAEAALISDSITVEDRVAAFAFFYTMWDTGITIGSLFAGFAVSIVSMPIIFKICALIVLVGIIFFSAIVKERKIH